MEDGELQMKNKKRQRDNMENFDLIRQQFLEVVDNQLEMGKPKETRQTLQRLQGLGYSELEAKSLIAQCVASEMYAVFQSNEPYNSTPSASWQLPKQ